MMTRSLPDCDFGELVWENGQILTRVLSSAGSHESHRWTGFSLHDSEAQREVGRETSMEKRGRLWDKEFSGHTHQDSLKKECYSSTELMARFSGSILNNEFAYISNSHDEQLVPSADYRNFKQGNACILYPQVTRPIKGDHQICNSSIQQWAEQASLSSQIPVPTSGILPSSKMQEGEPKNRIGQMNFSYFLKLAALDKAKALINDAARATTSPCLSRLEKPKSTDYANGAIPFELRPIEPPTCPVPPKMLLQPAEHDGQEAAFGRINTASANQVHEPNQSFAASIVKGKQGKSRAEKSVELLVPSSSTCSREASNCPSYSLKSKCQDYEESEHPSQSFEEEPRRAAGAMSNRRGSAGSKRQRTAKVHSLSEKRRRDRINKKVRLLQELIPNCKKGDKISILDEAIDYLKTLQLQVQVMSMGAGLCMPPVMIPPALQHIQAAQLPHYSPMGVGMGMGMGMGLGMGCRPERFPSPHILGAGGLSGIAGTAHQMVGHPGQVIPVSLSSAPPFIPLHAGSLTQSVLVPSVPKDSHSVEHSSSSPSSN